MSTRERAVPTATESTAAIALDDPDAPATARPSAVAVRAPTILDLAAASGVSKATVSRVLNGSPHVAPATRIRVEEAIAKSGFRVNRAARSLRTSETGLVGVVVPIISVFGRIIEELDRELAEAGVSILLTASRRRQPERDLDGIEILVGHGVDALLLAPSDDRDPALVRKLAKSSIPTVLLDREVDGMAFDALFVDQDPGISGVMDHLVAGGRRKIGLLTRDDKTRPGRRILESYRENCQRIGVATDASLVREFDDLDRGTARDGVDALIDAGADAIISTGTMEHTATVLERLAERHIMVPRDLGLAVYGYVGGSSIGSMRLPTVGYPVDRIAHATFRLLMSRLADPGLPPRIETVPNVFIPPQRP